MIQRRSIRMAAIFDLLLTKGSLPVAEMTKEAVRKMAEPPPESLIRHLPWTPDGVRSRLKTMEAREEVGRHPAEKAHGKPGKPGYHPRTPQHFYALLTHSERGALLAAAYHRWPSNRR